MNNKNQLENKPLLKKLIKNPIAWAAFLFSIYSFIGFLIIPFIVKNQAVNYIKENFGREAKIESISFNPFTFSLSVKGFTLFDKDKSDFLSFSELFVDLNVLPLLSRKIELNKFKVIKPKVEIKKLSDSTFNFSDLMSLNNSTKGKMNSVIQPKSDNVKFAQIELTADNNNPSTKGAQSDGWDFLIQWFEISELSSTFKDESLDSQKVQFDIFDTQLTIINFHPLSTDTSRFNFSVKNKAGGNASLKGIFTLQPIASVFQISFDKFNLKQISPYLAEFAYLRLDNAKLNIDGSLDFKIGKKNELPDISFNGHAGLDSLILFDTKEQERFLELSSLLTSEINIRTNPIVVAIGEVTLNKVYSRIAIAEDQTINIQKVFKDYLKDSVTTNNNMVKAFNEFDNHKIQYEKSFSYDTNNNVLKQDFTVNSDSTLDNFNFDIGRIKILDSEMFFSDFSLPLKFAARIHDLKGEIIGISYGNPLGAAIDLEGIVDEYGLARIKGNMDPFEPMEYSDIKTNFNNIELTNLSPYSAKFMGYVIESGKLSLDVEYVLEKGMLKSYSKIFLNKIELGDEVEGQEGFGIPVKLALALLKDGDGNIDLDLEVEGDLNDPQVNTGTLVWWAVKRVLVSIVTAPFKLLGNLLGLSGDDLEFVDFDPGESRVLPNQIEKLANLNKALNERPGITLEIYGAVDTVVDAQAIRSKKLKDTFTKRMTKSIGDSLVDPMKVDVSISRNILENMFKELFSKTSLDSLQRKFYSKADQDDSKSVQDFDLRNYLKELIKILSDKQPVSKEELLKLASNRTEAIIMHMVTVLQTNPERLVTMEPEIYEQEDRNWVKCRLGIGTL